MIDLTPLAETALAGEAGEYVRVGPYLGAKVLSCSRSMAIREYVFSAWAAQSGYTPKFLALGKTGWLNARGERISLPTIFQTHVKGETVEAMLRKFGAKARPNFTTEQQIRYAAEHSSFDSLLDEAYCLRKHLMKNYDLVMGDHQLNMRNFMYYKKRKEMRVIDFSYEWKEASEQMRKRVILWAEREGILLKSVPDEPYFSELARYNNLN